MLLASMRLRDFRTYARCEIPLASGLTVVYGPNGAGKSNLLEAICFACTGHSPRTRNERELIRFGAQAARVEAVVLDGGREHVLAVGYGSPAAGEQTVKRMWLDGAPVPRLSDVQSRPLVSVFQPDRLELLKGPPAVRRAHLDRFTAALWPLSADVRRSYGQALAQRNALLQRVRSGRAAAAHLDTWDRELARHALELRDQRARAVELLSEPFSRRARELGLDGEAGIEYRPRTRAPDAEGFIAELAERAGTDLERGFTSHGPHRDEVLLRRDGRELRIFGSQGEQRLAVLALLLAERTVLEDERGRLPLMLLDDVMSELDAGRRELLAAELARAGQSVIAATDLEHVPGARAATASRLRVAPGLVLREELAA